MENKEIENKSLSPSSETKVIKKDVENKRFCVKCGYTLQKREKKFWCGYCKVNYSKSGKEFKTITQIKNG